MFCPPVREDRQRFSSRSTILSHDPQFVQVRLECPVMPKHLVRPQPVRTFHALCAGHLQTNGFFQLRWMPVGSMTSSAEAHPWQIVSSLYSKLPDNRSNPCRKSVERIVQS